MCLFRPKKKQEAFNIKKENGYVVAWKIFVKCSDKRLKFPHYGPWDINLPKKEWIKEENYRQHYQSKIQYGQLYGGSYKTGFHSYVSLGDARKNVRRTTGAIIKKVYLKNIVQYGWQEKEKVLVSKQIFICRK